jgi:hypothetical protein
MRMGDTPVYGKMRRDGSHQFMVRRQWRGSANLWSDKNGGIPQAYGMMRMKGFKHFMVR